MVKEGYSKKFTCAVTGASSVVGPIIPPSMPMIIAAYLSRQSVSKMFVGGIVPGILFGGGMMIWSYVYSKRHGFPFKKRASLTEILKTFKSALLPLLAPVIILGGIFTGAFTVTEIGAIAAIYGTFLGFFYFKELNFKKFLQVALNTAMRTGSVMIIVALANVYTWMLTRERAPQLLYQFVLNLTSDPLIILLLIVVSLLIFGCFLSTTPAIILAVPILLPLVKHVGFDPVYFFVLLTVTLCIGTITPPVGLTLYMVSSIGKVEPESVLKPLLPFFAIMIGVVLLCVFFPPIILGLVHFIKY
ncbi:Sialic acid TRAP transporter large permease protein SiaM [subsurface metagenome]